VRDYIAANRAATERLVSLVDRLSDDDLARKFDWGWTVAVALAHVAFFDRRAARLVERWQENGVGPSPYDADAINDAMLPAWLLIPPRAAANEALAAAAEVDEAVANLSDDLLEQILQGGSVNPNRAGHRTMHLNEIESLLA
jgi:uncharacterized damage-inducible protein DinB